MSLARASRRLVAWVAGACVVFAHTAALASGCAMEIARSLPQASQPCPEHARHDPSGAAANANVCEVHCQAVTLPPIDAGASYVPVALASTIPVPLRLVGASDVAPLPPDPRGTPPPLLLRTSRLLI